MSHCAAIWVLLALSLTVLTACTKLSKRESDPIMGEFEGTFTPQGGQAVKAKAKVIADENNKYRVVILYPAAAAKTTPVDAKTTPVDAKTTPVDAKTTPVDAKTTPVDAKTTPVDAKTTRIDAKTTRIDAKTTRIDAKTTRIELTGRAKDGEISIAKTDWAGKLTAEPWSGTITRDSLQIAAEGDKGGKAEMKRVEQKIPPTLGQKPPAGAVVLLPFEEGKVTNLDQWSNKEWICEPDGSIQAYRGDNRTKKEFGSFKLHLEFYVPFLPAMRAPRGHSGVYLHNCYKIEILDSFGEPVTDMVCGAISGQKPPDVDVALPAAQWQTYDIDFKAPRFNEINGDQVRGALVTVLLNGVKIDDAFEVFGVTGGALSLPNKRGPLRLQDHNDPVRFRNIWLVEEK